MRRTRSNNALLRERLIDEAIERYVDWREACAAVGDMYARFSRASAGERALSFAAYRAALDQEESAATLYGVAVDRVGAAPPDTGSGWTRLFGPVPSESLADT
jgi:hypothetical protein